MSVDRFSLSGRVALVTGGGSGLGLAVARGLAAAGATVAINGRDRAKLEDAAKTAPPARLRPFAFDVSDPDAARRGAGEVEAALGPIAVLVNAAGIQQRGPAEAFSAADWNRILATNLSAPFFVAQALIPGMIGRRNGKIINVLSLNSELGRSSIVPYTASKGGLRMLTRGLAVERAKHNIQVNGIAPGYFKTAMYAALIDDPKFNAWVPDPGRALGRAGGTDRRGRVLRLRGVGLRNRTGAVRRRRLLGVDVAR